MTVETRWERIWFMQRRRWIAAALAAALIGGTVLVGAAGCGKDDAHEKALNSFLAAWHDGKLGPQKLLDANGAPLAGDAAQAQLTEIEGDLGKRRPNLKVGGRFNLKDKSATVVVAVDWPLTDAAIWSYPTTVRLAKRGDAWLPVFSPATIHPDLPAAGAKLVVKQTASERGPIADAAGKPIVTNRPVVIVGVEPRRVTDQSTLIGGLKSIFAELGVQVDVDSLPARLKSAKPDAFVEVAVLRREDYDRVRLSIRGLPGTLFKEAVQPLAPSRAYARALLGQVGDVTKEIIDKNAGKYRAGDRIGLTGLQQRYEDRLRGAPGVTVLVGEKKLFEAPAVTGPAVKITIDERIQSAADSALGGETRRGALVAIRISDGAVVAAANSPGGGQLNLAFTAAVPPGSTFKMVSSLGLLDNGSVGLDTPVDCPETRVVDGRTFKNADNLGALGQVPFRTAFAKSCNTVFADLAPKLGPDGLAAAGQALGLGGAWDLGTEVNSGKVSQGGSATERAAAAFGQGTTQVSPVAMAAAAAAVARGQWKQPVLVLDPTPAKPAADGPALKPESVAALRTLMREVVTSGTASALAGLAGEPLHGKTGTAEFDSRDPNKSHAWFIGWKGDLAFAVFVENGGGGSATAVPIAGKFFNTLGA
jgi:cell division protein FtsI/penicillin-binding protein 2